MSFNNFNLENALKNTHFLFDWWWDIDESNESNESNEFKQIFNNELKHEVTPGHKLYGCDLKIIARRESNDDYLFKFVADERVASVHLTWRKSTEVLPFSASEIFQNLDDWFEREYFPSLTFPLNKPE